MPRLYSLEISDSQNLCTFSAGRAVLVHVSRADLDLDRVVSGFAVDLVYLGHGDDRDLWIVLDAFVVDLKSACGRAEFGEILFELGNPSAKGRFLLNNKDLIPPLRQLPGQWSGR